MITLIVTLLIQFGYLSNAAEWNGMNAAEQQEMRGKVVTWDIVL
jgi:hypothetical protein